MDSLNSQVSKNFPYRSKLWIPLVLILVAVLSGISGYLIGAGTGKSTKRQLVLQPIYTAISTTPSAVPTVAPTAIFYPQTIDTAKADWKTYTSSDGSYSFQYPPQWLMGEGMLNGGEAGVTVNGSEGDFTIVIPTVPFPTCEGDTQQVQLQGEIIAACHQINPNGSESWNAMMQQLSSAKKFRIQATTATPAQNNRALLLQIFSTLTFK